MIKELGEIIRLPEGDPRREVTFLDEVEVELNLPQTQRVGRPRSNWIITAMQTVWNHLELSNRISERECVCFDHRNHNHVNLVYGAGRIGKF